MSEEINYAERVQRGIALLDEKWPTWAKDIDLDKLDIRSGDYCVTAQCSTANGGEASWIDGQDFLEIPTRESYVEHGFNADEADLDGADREAGGVAFDALNGLWKAAIERRRAQAQPEASER